MLIRNHRVQARFQLNCCYLIICIAKITIPKHLFGDVFEFLESELYGWRDAGR
jgi:hypothetical protein